MSAAPFVWGAPQPLARRIADSRAAVIAVPADGKGWRVEVRLHDVTGAVAPGNVIQPSPAPPPETKAAVLIARRDKSLASVPLSDTAREYVKSLPQSDAPIERRLTHACLHLGGDDETVARDAYAMLARASGEELRRHRAILPADRLRKLVQSPSTPADRVALYGYLLGLVGDEQDAMLIRNRLDADDEGLCTDSAGLLAGYLLLTGEEGLAEWEGKILLGGERTPIFVAAFYESLRTLQREHPDLFAPDRLRRTAECGLNRTDAADLAIGYLAARRDWTALPDVARMVRSRDPNTDRRRAVQIAAVRFLMECRRDTDAAVHVRSRAESLLRQLADSDRDLLRRAERIAGAPPRE